MKKKHKKGFTLIELLVVISIIGLISTVAVIAFTNVRRKSRNSTRVSNMKQIAAAMELVYAENDAYDVLVNNPTAGSCNTGARLNTCIGLQAFYSGIANMHDPLYKLTGGTPNQNACVWNATAQCDYAVNYIDQEDYELLFFLEPGKAGDLSGPGIFSISPQGFWDNPIQP